MWLARWPFGLHMPDREVYVAQSGVTVGDRGVAVAVILIARFDGDVDQLGQATTGRMR